MIETSESLDSLSIEIEQLRARVRDAKSPSLLAELGQLLRRRSALTRSLADLDAAVEAFEAAVHVVTSQGLDVAQPLSNLAALLYERFTVRGSVLDLDRAIAHASKAVSLSEGSGSRHPEYLANYAAALYSRYELSGEPEDIHAAVRISERALELADERSRGAYLANLSTALQAEFGLSGDLRLLDRAITVAHEAVEITSRDDAARSNRLYALGLALALRAAIDHSPETLKQALSTLTSVIEEPAVGDSERLSAAELAMLATADRLDWLTALGVGSETLQRVGESYWDPDLMARRALLAADTAACALRLDDIGRALSFFESGRARFWSQEFLMRRDLSALRQAAPYLADSVLELARRLRRRPMRYGLDSWSRDRQQWELEVRRVRALPGFEKFLREPESMSLHTGPHEVLIAINVSRFGSDAIVVGQDKVTSVSLPKLTLQAALEQAKTYTEHVLTNDSTTSIRNRELQLTETLSWLWEVLGVPLVDALDLEPHVHTGSRLNVKWCISGPLSVIPVHAAGVPPTSQRLGESLIDFVNSSYVLRVQDMLDVKASEPVGYEPDWRFNALVIAPSDLDAPLLSVPMEISALRATLNKADALTGVEAVRGKILSEMPEHTLVHFAGHGRWDPEDTFKSGLLLADGVLTVDDLANRALSSTNLVVLLASCTALGDLKSTNEFISPAGAALVAGCSNVVGTYLSIRDRDASEFAAYFYRYLSSGAPALTHENVARATSEALRRLRQKYPDTPSAWAGIVHLAGSAA